MPAVAWSWRETRLANTGEWSYVAIPIDLRPAVTLVATIAAELPQGPGVHDSVWVIHHERILNWRIEDSLDGETWFAVDEGGLTRTSPRRAIRVSAPLGAHARLAWWPVCVVAQVRRDDGSTQSRNYCPGTSCGVNHETFEVTNAVFNVLVRSI